MAKKASDLPPLAPLKVFEVAARLQNFNPRGKRTRAQPGGEGVVLGLKYLCDELLNSGALICLPPKSLRTERGYYVVLKEPLVERALEFCDGLIAETASGMNQL